MCQQVLLQWLERRSWLACSWSAAAARLGEAAIESSAGCLLRELLIVDSASQDRLLTASARERMVQWVEAGVAISSAWPRPWYPAITQWIGKRLFLLHARHLKRHARFATIVCSRIGREGKQFSRWPHLVAAALNSVARNDQWLLIHEGTTSSEIVQHFASWSNTNYLSVKTSGRQSILAWLDDNLLHLSNDQWDPDAWQNEFACRMVVSPASQEPGEAEPELKEPIQDRIPIACADIVYALSVRKNGNLERLLNRRLSDAGFPLGSVRVAVAGSQISKRDCSERSAWLDRGAIGWYVRIPGDTQDFSELVRCRGFHGCTHQQRPESASSVQQLIAPAPATWAVRQGDDEQLWSYLCHCTRGGSARFPEESFVSYYHRVWATGVFHHRSPLMNLMRICRQQRLVATRRLTRTSVATVSLSSVPLPELLRRRSYQSHLNRWDWEPYGILVQKSALQEAGAREVIYGQEEDYQRLTVSDQPYFQPTGKLKQPKQYRWIEEREWRLIGDLDLRTLPPDTIQVFVKTRWEAQAVARQIRWPVLWVEHLL